MVVGTESEPPKAQAFAYSRCQRCKSEFEYQPIMLLGREWFQPKHCPDCLPVAAAEREAEAMREQVAKENAEWEQLCPPLYRDTDPARLAIVQATIEKVMGWQANSQGIGLAGSSGAGKTRLMFLLLRRLHFSGVRCKAITAKRFEKWCHRMFDKDDDARNQIASTHNIPVLFIDDIGKEKYTERVESEFYDLIEHRTSHLLPILWTANATGEQLAQMMGADRGIPIVRRLREFSTVISV